MGLLLVLMVPLWWWIARARRAEHERREDLIAVGVGAMVLVVAIVVSFVPALTQLAST